MRTILLDHHLDEDLYFDNARGLNVAVALTAYDNEREVILDPSYGEIIFELYSWGDRGEDQSTTFATSNTKPLPAHPCTPTELEESFMPTFARHKRDLSLYEKKFVCANDPGQFLIYGDYNSQSAQKLSVRFQVCSDRPECKPKKAVLDWLRGKYILLLYN